MLEQEGEGLVVTAAKRAENGDGAVVRVYNTLDRPTKGRLRLSEPWQEAQLVDMKEDPLGPAEIVDGGVHLDLRPNEIVTLQFDTGLA